MASTDRAPDLRDDSRHPLNTSSDAELVARIRAGELAAFDVLYVRYHPRLLDFAYRYVRSREAAEDIVQETMLALWRNRGTRTDTQNVAAYLYAAIRNRALQAGRHAAIVQRTNGIATPGDLPGTEPPTTPAALVEREDLRQIVRSTLSTLSPDQQRVILLRYRDGLTSEEIGTVLGISMVAAKKQVQRAVGALSALLKSVL